MRWKVIVESRDTYQRTMIIVHAEHSQSAREEALRQAHAKGGSWYSIRVDRAGKR